MQIPEEIKIKTGEFTKPKRGRPTTEQARRKSTPVRGKVQGNRQHYTDKEKMEAACTFAVCGNSRRAAELTKIPEATIRAWKTTEWWNDIQGRIIKEQDEELDVKLTKMVDKAVDAINDRLESGDFVYNAKEDKLIRKPVPAKDLAIVTAITLDKRQLLRGQPTSRVEKVSQEERLLKLADQFRSFANAKEVVQDNSINEKEIIDDYKEASQEENQG